MISCSLALSDVSAIIFSSTSEKFVELDLDLDASLDSLTLRVQLQLFLLFEKVALHFGQIEFPIGLL